MIKIWYVFKQLIQTGNGATNAGQLQIQGVLVSNPRFRFSYIRQFGEHIHSHQALLPHIPRSTLLLHVLVSFV